MEIKTSNKIAIIDLDSILFAAAWGNKIYIEDDEYGTPIYQRDEKGRLLYEDKSELEIKLALDSILIDILNNTGANAYVAFVKGKNTSKYRYDIKSDYKANRPKESPSWWEFTKNYCIDSWNAIAVDNIEVDDAVNITRLNIKDSFIVAIDKDLLNLEGTHYNWKKKEWVTVTEEEASLHFFTDMIVGQPGDNIKGIPGKGLAYAKKLYLNIEDDSDSLYNTCYDAYLDYYEDDFGHNTFTQNYTCLKILDNYDGFNIPTPIEYDKLDKITKMLEEIDRSNERR